MIGRDRRGGSLYIERMIGGRRFRRATGLPDTPRGRKTAVLYDGMIDTLLAAGRTDLVRGLSEKNPEFF